MSAKRSKVFRQPPRDHPPITFGHVDLEGVINANDDPLVITVFMANCRVKRTFIASGIAENILYWSTFLKLGISHDFIKPHPHSLVGVTGIPVQTRGYVELLTTFGEGELSETVLIKYVLIDAQTAYNALIGRSTLSALGAIVSIVHLAMKFPSSKGGIVTVKAEQVDVKVKAEQVEPSFSRFIL